MDEEKESVREDLGYIQDKPTTKLPLDISKSTHWTARHQADRTMRNLEAIHKVFPDAAVDAFGMIVAPIEKHQFWPSSDCFFNASKQIYGIDIVGFCNGLESLKKSDK